MDGPRKDQASIGLETDRDVPSQPRLLRSGKRGASYTRGREGLPVFPFPLEADERATRISLSTLCLTKWLGRMGMVVSPSLLLLSPPRSKAGRSGEEYKGQTGFPSADDRANEGASEIHIFSPRPGRKRRGNHEIRRPRAEDDGGKEGKRVGELKTCQRGKEGEGR